jgi:hypothetical protein
LFTEAQRMKIACEIVRDERKAHVIEEEVIEVPVRGITPNKLLEVAEKVRDTYHARKSKKKRPDFEQIVEDMVRVTFKDERAQHIAKHVLGHYFAWRRNRCLPKEAHDIARRLGYTLL